MLESTEDPLAFAPAVGDKYLLYAGISTALGPNRDPVPRIFLSERLRNPGATTFLTEFSEGTGGIALGGQLDKSVRYGVFAVRSNSAETTLYRVRIR